MYRLFRFMLQNELATCYDNGPSSYYLRESTTGSTRYVFYAEDGGGDCIYSKDLCDVRMKEQPYFGTSSDRYRRNEEEFAAMFSDDPAVSPYAGSNFIFMNYCTQDVWLGRLTDSMHPNGYYLRGAIIMESILSEVLDGVDMSTIEIVLAGTSAGAIGVMNIADFVVKDLGVPINRLSMIIDSFNSPITSLKPEKVSIASRILMHKFLICDYFKDMISGLIPYIMNYTKKSTRFTDDHFPCVFSYSCLKLNGFIPDGIRTLIMTSSYDPVVMLNANAGLHCKYRVISFPLKSFFIIIIQ